MNPLTARQIAEVCGGHLAAGNPAALVSNGVCTDTRKLVPQCAFFALSGDRFDGASFAPSALAAGACAVVVNRWDPAASCPDHAAVILHPNPLVALQRLAAWWRRQLHIPVIGITGSNGKTSTKDFTAAVLRQQFEVAATVGNLNNHIGVPLSVLATNSQHQAAIYEMGMNHAGEIAPLCEIAKPRFGIITHIGTAHIEFLGSRQAIAEEKGMLARALPADGILFLPATCDFLDYLRQRTKATLIAVGNGRGLVRAEALRPTEHGTDFSLVIEDVGACEVHLPVPGKHMVTNALLAAAAGWKLGIPIEAIAAGLSAARLTHGRLAQRLHHGITLIDDTYNANPDSMIAALETAAALPTGAAGRHIAVLGRMGELGSHAEAGHRQVGAAAAALGFVVATVGPGCEEIVAAAGPTAQHFPTHQEAASWLAATAQAGDVVLFKGSRSATIELVLQAAFPTP